MLGIACLASAPTMAGEPAWWTQQKRNCGLPSNLAYNNWDGRCGSTPSGGYRDYEAERRAQEAAAEAERQRQAEVDRIERERLAEEKRKNDEFIRNRDATVLKGSSGTNTSQLKGISGTDNYGLKGSGTDPGAQLKSVERHSREAQEQASRGKETARETARMGFDTPGKASGGLVYPDKKQRQIPPSALDKRVPPEAQKDPQVQQSLARYTSSMPRRPRKKMIAEIKEQQKTSKDPILGVKIATLNNDVKRATDDQAKVTETVKKQVKNLGFNLVESAEPTTTEANKK